MPSYSYPKAPRRSFSTNKLLKSPGLARDAAYQNDILYCTDSTVGNAIMFAEPVAPNFYSLFASSVRSYGKLLFSVQGVASQNTPTLFGGRLFATANDIGYDEPQSGLGDTNTRDGIDPRWVRLVQGSPYVENYPSKFDHWITSFFGETFGTHNRWSGRIFIAHPASQNFANPPDSYNQYLVIGVTKRTQFVGTTLSEWQVLQLDAPWAGPSGVYRAPMYIPVNSGGDGFWAIEEGANTYGPYARDGLDVVLITGSLRKYPHTGTTQSSARSAVQRYGGKIHVIVNCSFQDAFSSRFVFGVGPNGEAYSSFDGFEPPGISTGGRVHPAYDRNVIDDFFGTPLILGPKPNYDDYVQLAWSTGGWAWDSKYFGRQGAFARVISPGAYDY